KHQRHLIHTSVTTRTAYSLVHVNAVVEINVVRQPVHLHPLNRSVRAIAFANRLQISNVVEKHRMTGHAGFGGRNASGRRGFNTGVTVTAVDSVIAHVMLVAELYWLGARDILPREIWRSGQHQHGCQTQSGQEYPRKQTEPCNEIRTAVKNLGHV